MSFGRYRATGCASNSAESVAAELGRRFGLRLRVFAARRLGSVAQGEDVSQETLRRVLEAMLAGRIENPEALPAFVFQTARNICLNERRSSGRAAKAFRLLSAHGEADPAPNPLEALLSEERRAQVRTALQLLDGEDRALLARLFMDDADAAEVARALGVSPGTLRTRKHRALKRLREALGEENPGNAGRPAAT